MAEEFDTQIKKLETCRTQQTQLPVSSPFFFEKTAKKKELPKEEKTYLNGWVTPKRVVIGVISIVVAAMVLIRIF